MISLANTYDTTGMADDTFTVSIVPHDEDSKTRELNVVEINATPGSPSLTVKYGGAYGGVYSLEVLSELRGALSTEGITFEAKIEVADFNPKQGSLYGGTLVTITGGHFSDTITDNPVQYEATYVGGSDKNCYVKAS